MNLFYVANTRLPTEKAHGLATVKICEAFAESGSAVELLVPRLWRPSGGDPYVAYAIKKNFKITKVPCIDLVPLPLPEKFTFLLQMVSFSFFAALYGFPRKKKDPSAIFFSHDYIPLFFLTFVSSNIYYDIHHYPGKNFMYARVMKKSFGFAVQTSWKAKEIEKDFGIEAEKIVYWPNGTDSGKIAAISRDSALSHVAIPKERKIILYVGALFDWKGVDTLLKAFHFIPRDAFIYIVGGSKKDIGAMKEKIEEACHERVVFVPFVPHEEVAYWLRAADVLVLPNTAKQKVSLYYTSPMKLFEYMASGVPIVASRIPSILEIVDDSSALLAEADNPESFGRVITSVFEKPAVAFTAADRAKELVKQYTWHERARKILSHAKRLAKQ